MRKERDEEIDRKSHERNSLIPPDPAGLVHETDDAVANMEAIEAVRSMTTEEVCKT